MNLTEHDKAELTRHMESATDRNFARRLKAVQESATGKTCKQIAEDLGVSDESVRGWLRNYEKGGIEALQYKKRTGRPSLFSAEDEARVLGDLRESPTRLGYLLPDWTFAILRDHVHRVVGVEIDRHKADRLFAAAGVEKTAVKKLTLAKELALTKEVESKLSSWEFEEVWLLGREPLGDKWTGGVAGSQVQFRQEYYLLLAVNLERQSKPEVYLRFEKRGTDKAFHEFVQDLVGIRDRSEVSALLLLVPRQDFKTSFFEVMKLDPGLTPQAVFLDQVSAWVRAFPNVALLKAVKEETKRWFREREDESCRSCHHLKSEARKHLDNSPWVTVL
jgi:transposase